jgi:uncharacterized protein GlcG (DUF336 family)
MSSNSYTRHSITEEAARAIVAASIEKATSMGAAFTIAVVDESGVIKALARMDGAPLLSVQVAQDKAYTAAGFSMATDDWYDFIKDDEPLRIGATAGIDRLVVFGGGYPIEVDGEVVGAVGVSGGHYTHDMEVAQAGLRAILAD